MSAEGAFPARDRVTSIPGEERVRQALEPEDMRIIDLQGPQRRCKLVEIIDVCAAGACRAADLSHHLGVTSPSEPCLVVDAADVDDTVDRTRVAQLQSHRMALIAISLAMIEVANNAFHHVPVDEIGHAVTGGSGRGNKGDDATGRSGDATVVV